MAPRKWGFDLKSNSTNYPDHGHHGNPPPHKENPHGRAGNRTRDLVISSQKLWPLDHEAGPSRNEYLCLDWIFVYLTNFVIKAYRKCLHLELIYHYYIEYFTVSSDILLT